ncbi:MAG TPA: S-methyl-5'-thioinosine phosphorylase [Candidatus Aphodousia faecigallinarum]|uniref:S-methyl-5'-thioinosine phosphorylase n=1 Tax=Candidatus Aphodousia faecigallinarum TaxID=2840677 RepID=A0A9D1IHZ1_9BURK|nr:S-methyl-5'-thioinosine phosphorylase [Candidatus Aphodousia faecigallinarum]
MLGLVVGSGFESFELLEAQTVTVQTPFGKASFDLGFCQGQKIALLHRHGKDHRLAPHQIPYKAQMWALKQSGVTDVIALGSVGGMAAENAPGHFTLADQIIDYTAGRESTYWGEVNMPCQHIDFTHPFDESLRQKVLDAAHSLKIFVYNRGTYGCTQGPRLETAAEVKRMIMDGCDMVGMTAMPEAALARELGIRYALLCFSVNWAAGLVDEKLDFELIKTSMDRSVQTLVRLLNEVIRQNQFV